MIGEPDRDQLDAAVADAERRLARPVQASIRSSEWWKEGDDAFRTEVTTRPLVVLLDQSSDS